MAQGGQGLDRGAKGNFDRRLHSIAQVLYRCQKSDTSTEMQQPKIESESAKRAIDREVEGLGSSGISPCIPMQ